MNINLIRLKGLIRELSRIADAAERIAVCEERKLSEDGIYVRPIKQDTTGPEPSVSYSDEELDYLNEFIEEERRRAGKKVRTSESNSDGGINDELPN
jgi:hypothetical protein